MSRHDIPTVEGVTVVVGWDPPLQTFFGQVYHPEDDEDAGPRLWVGVMDRLSTVEDLLDELGEWASAVSGAMRLQLVEDKEYNRA